MDRPRAVVDNPVILDLGRRDRGGVAEIPDRRHAPPDRPPRRAVVLHRQRFGPDRYLRTVESGAVRLQRCRRTAFIGQRAGPRVIPAAPGRGECVDRGARLLSVVIARTNQEERSARNDGDQQRGERGETAAGRRAAAPGGAGGPASRPPHIAVSAPLTPAPRRRAATAAAPTRPLRCVRGASDRRDGRPGGQQSAAAGQSCPRRATRHVARRRRRARALPGGERRRRAGRSTAGVGHAPRGRAVSGYDGVGACGRGAPTAVSASGMTSRCSHTRCRPRSSGRRGSP